MTERMSPFERYELEESNVESIVESHFHGEDVKNMIYTAKRSLASFVNNLTREESRKYSPKVYELRNILDRISVNSDVLSGAGLLK